MTYGEPTCSHFCRTGQVQPLTPTPLARVKRCYVIHFRVACVLLSIHENRHVNPWSLAEVSSFELVHHAGSVSPQIAGSRADRGDFCTTAAADRGTVSRFRLEQGCNGVALDREGKCCSCR